MVQGFDKAGSLGEGRKDALRRARDLLCTPGETPQGAHHTCKLREPPALRPCPQLSVFFFLLPNPEGFQKKGRLGYHPLPSDGGGGLVAIEKISQISARDMLPGDPAAEGRRMAGIGARQRCKHAGCGPA